MEHRIGTTPATGPDKATFAAPAATGIMGVTPNVAIDGLGNLHMVLVSGAIVWDHRWSAATQAWSAVYAVSDAGPYSPYQPSVAADERGGVHVVWSDGRPENGFDYQVFYDADGCLTLPLSSTPPPAAAAKLSAEMLAMRASASPSELLPVILLLSSQPDREALATSVRDLPAGERRRVCAGGGPNPKGRRAVPTATAAPVWLRDDDRDRLPGTPERYGRL